jgi:hypothetical protein
MATWAVHALPSPACLLACGTNSRRRLIIGQREMSELGTGQTGGINQLDTFDWLHKSVPAKQIGAQEALRFRHVGIFDEP